MRAKGKGQWLGGECSPAQSQLELQGRGVTEDNGPQWGVTWWGEGPSGNFLVNMHSATAACLLGDSEGSSGWQNEHALSRIFSIKLSFSLGDKSALASCLAFLHFVFSAHSLQLPTSSQASSSLHLEFVPIP